MLRKSLLLALLATTLPAQSALIDLRADYSISQPGSGLVYTASEVEPGGQLTTVGAKVAPAILGDDIVNTARDGAAFTGDPTPVGEATANGNAAGHIAVQAGYSSSAGYTVDSLHAKTVWSDTVVNNSGGDQSYTFDFHILPGGILAGSDNSGTWDSGGLHASYNIQIMVDNNVVWNSSASLRVGKESGNLNHDLVLTGTELTRIFSDALSSGLSGPLSFGSSGAGYTFGGYDGLLNLGTLANNSSMTLSYLMEVSVSGRMAENGVYAAFGDPLNLTAGGMNGQIIASGGGPNPTPEPASLLLLGLGLAGLGWMRKQD